MPALPAPAAGDALDKPELEPLTVACRIEKKEERRGVDEEEAALEEAEREDEDDVPGFYIKPAGARNGGPRPFYARLRANERLTPPDWPQETRHYVWDIAGLEGVGEEEEGEGEGVYRAGDVAYVYPENPGEGVAAGLALLGLAATDVLHLSSLVVGGDGGEEEAAALDLPVRCTAGRLLRR